MLKQCLAAAIIVAGTAMVMPGAGAQRVTDDIARWSDRQCAWLHRQALAECQEQAACSSLPEKIDFSMSTARGLAALEGVLTAANTKHFYEICERACTQKKRPSYAEFRTSFCDRVRPSKAK